MNKVKPGKQNSPRILMIHAEGNFFNNPSLKSILDLLVDSEYEVDLRYQKSHAPMPVQFPSIRFKPYGRILGRIKRLISDQICTSFLIYLMVCIERWLYYDRYDLVIAVDRQGLLEASVLNQLTGTAYIFISFEIFFESETSARFKSLEKKASKNASFWIVQDKVRAGELKRENGLDDSNRILLPVSSAGTGELATARLRDKLGIPKGKNVAIVIGSIASWTLTRETMLSVIDWPESWVLIVHERYGHTRELLKNELLELGRFINDRIYISDEAIDRVDDLAMILSGVDVGIALYRPDFQNPYTGNNLKYIGLASGKISTYLRYGLAVIVNRIGLYAEEVEKHDIGFVVDEAEDIPSVLNAIGGGDYQARAKKYYSSCLDFNIHADKLLAAVNSVLERSQTTDDK